MPLTPDLSTSIQKPIAAIVAASFVLICLAAGGIVAISQVAMAPSTVPASLAVESGRHKSSLFSNSHAQLHLSSAGPSWKELSVKQREVLMPLREHWEGMGSLTKRRWLVLADRYPSMDATERTKLVSRMETWASLSAQQRSQARLNFESAKRLSPKDLQTKWDQYQALSEEEKQRLAEQARKAKTANKKAKRRIARVPAAPQPKPAPSAEMPTQIEAPPSSPAVETAPIFTPQANPIIQLPPLEIQQPTEQPETTPSPPPPPSAAEVSSLPIATPIAMPTVEIPPLANSSTQMPDTQPLPAPTAPANGLDDATAAPTAPVAPPAQIDQQGTSDGLQ